MVKPATNDFMSPPFEIIGWKILAALAGRLHGTPMHVNGFYGTLVAKKKAIDSTWDRKRRP
jgi:hypothetical protein